jgi:hypothetical protein
VSGWKFRCRDVEIPAALMGFYSAWSDQSLGTARSILDLDQRKYQNCEPMKMVLKL